MKIGTEQVKHKILQALRKSKASLKDVKYGEFADDLTDEIFKLLGDDMNKGWNVAHDFPEECEKIARRLESGLKFNMFPRTAEAKEIYLWVIEQEAQGFKLERFIGWALSPERIQYAGKYRAKPVNIKADYPQAFLNVTEKKQVVLERNL